MPTGHLDDLEQSLIARIEAAKDADALRPSASRPSAKKAWLPSF